MVGNGVYEREWQARRRRIDGRLQAGGWPVVPVDSPRKLTPEAITEYETDHGPADYALCADGRILGVVEAKRLTIGAENALTQAERYSRGVSGSPFDFNGYRVPFLYSTNGEVIWFHDVRHPLNRSRRVEDFHMPNALREMLGRDLDAECQWLSDNPIQHTSSGSASPSSPPPAPAASPPTGVTPTPTSNRCRSCCVGCDKDVK